MNCRKILFFVIIIHILLFPVALFADSEDSPIILDFSTTLRDIIQGDKEDFLDNDEVHYVISGIISSISFIDKDPANFLAELYVVDGEWIELSEVLMYNAVLKVSGSDFASRIPVRRSRNPADNEIKMNQTILFLATLEGYRDDPNINYSVPVFNVKSIRIIQK